MSVVASIALALTGSVPAATAASGWTPAVDVSGGFLNGMGEGIQFAVGPNNVVAATWSHFENSTYTIQASVSHDKGLTWSTPATISETDSHTETPHVAINGSGTILVAWGSEPASPWFTQYSRSLDGGLTWSSWATISDTNYSSEINSLVAVGDHGFAVLMSQTDGVRSDVVARYSNNDGASWSSFTTVSDGVNTSFFFDLAVDGQGNFGAVFMKLVGSQWEVQARTSQDGGVSWSAITDLYAGHEATNYPRILGLPQGGFTVVWESVPGATHEILASTGNGAGTTWSTPVPAGFTAVGDTPQFATTIGANGDIAVTWTMDDSGTRTLFCVLSHDGGLTWDLPSSVTEATMGSEIPLYAPKVAILSTGEIAIIWTNLVDRTAANDSVHVVLGTYSAPWTYWDDPVQISAPSAGDPGLAVTTTGDVIAGWAQGMDSGRNNIVVQASTRLAPALPDTGAAPWIGPALAGALALAGLGVLAIMVARRRLARV